MAKGRCGRGSWDGPTHSPKPVSSCGVCWVTWRDGDLPAYRRSLCFGGPPQLTGDLSTPMFWFHPGTTSKPWTPVAHWGSKKVAPPSWPWPHPCGPRGPEVPGSWAWSPIVHRAGQTELRFPLTSERQKPGARALWMPTAPTQALSKPLCSTVLAGGQSRPCRRAAQEPPGRRPPTSLASCCFFTCSKGELPPAPTNPAWVEGGLGALGTSQRHWPEKGSSPTTEQGPPP